VKDERKRLGSGLGGVKEVMAHPWFASIDWDALVHKRIKPPFKPSIRCGYCSYRD
jgi:RAC serine/threonine-protein kinase